MWHHSPELVVKKPGAGNVRSIDLSGYSHAGLHELFKELGIPRKDQVSRASQHETDLRVPLPTAGGLVDSFPAGFESAWALGTTAVGGDPDGPRQTAVPRLAALSSVPVACAALVCLLVVRRRRRRGTRTV